MRLRFAITGHSKSKIEGQQAAGSKEMTAQSDRPEVQFKEQAATSNAAVAETKMPAAETNGPAEATNNEPKTEAATGN
jgi:hypothetical protein